MLDADIYRNDIENLIDFFASTSADGTIFTPENIDRARTQGVELAARWTTGPWSFQAGYNYLDAKNLSAGVPLNRRSMHTGRFRTSRAWDRLAGLRLDVTGTLTGDAPIVESGLGTGGPPEVTGTQEALFTLDFRGAVTPIADIELSLGVDNLFNDQPAGWLGPIQRRFYLGDADAVAAVRGSGAVVRPRHCEERAQRATRQSRGIGTESCAGRAELRPDAPGLPRRSLRSLLAMTGGYRSRSLRIRSVIPHTVPSASRYADTRRMPPSTSTSTGAYVSGCSSVSSGTHCASATS